STGLAVVEGSLPLSTRSTGRFFPRRRRRKTRALGSPKMPRTVGSGRKPVNRYASSSRRGFRIRASCQIFRLEVKEKTLENKGFRSLQTRFLPTRLGEEPRRRTRTRDGGRVAPVAATS